MALKPSPLTFGVLVAALAVSTLSQRYRSTIMELPEYDGLTATTAGAYAALVGVSALVLTDRLWAWGGVSALVLSLLALTLFWYFPVVVPARIDAGALDPVGWLEAVVYAGLLSVAAFVCALRLLGAHPAPKSG